MRLALSAVLGILSMIGLAFVPSPAQGQEGPDEFESNDTKEKANSISGDEILGEVGGRTDSDDWFVLEGQEGSFPEITLWYDADRCDVDMDVWSDDELVGSLTDTASPDRSRF